MCVGSAVPLNEDPTQREALVPPVKEDSQEPTPLTVPPAPQKSQQTSTPVVFSTSKSANTWETLVLFAVNLAKLEINMNMGNVMGNTMYECCALFGQNFHFILVLLDIILTTL